MKVKKYVLDNKRYRYLLPEEEPVLMAALEGPRAHLKPMVKIALGTGMRLGEQLRLLGESGLVTRSPDLNQDEEWQGS